MAESEKVTVEVPRRIAGLVAQLAKHSDAKEWGDFSFSLRDGGPVGNLRMALTEPIKETTPSR